MNTAPNPACVHARWLIRHDYPAVLAIEAASSPFPWSEDDLLRHGGLSGMSGLVAEHAGSVVAFAVYRLGRTRIDLLKLAVAPTHRRSGVGRQVVARLAAKLRPGGRERITAHVRETNVAGQLALAALGFVATGVEREHFADTDEDSFVMTYFCDDMETATR